jgi:D-alanine--poly(phosphoribitol) ligase subunit 1
MSYIERFALAARQVPSRPAVVESGRTVSYDEFGSLVRRLAHALGHATRGDKVLIHLPQVAKAFAAMFAVGLAGGYYATTNVAAPPERRRGTFDAFAPDVVVTNSAYAAEAKSACPTAAIIDVDVLGREELANPRPPHRLAYVMFTSGSTGRPKGVMISKDALSHYVDWIMDAMEVRPDDRWSQHPNIAFDLSVLDIFGALCAGAALVPITGADLILPAKAIRRHRLTIWDSVPSILTSMIKTRRVTGRNLESLRLLTFCGEPLQKLHVDALFGARPDVVVHNTYGPTEATVSCTLLRLTADNYKDACQATVAIGTPIPDMEIDLIGGDGADQGEIVISGPQLADGYWNDPLGTEHQFRMFVRNGVATRGYFTGDWAQRVGKHVYFRSRIDTQVKIRGERIELDDISSALMKCGPGFACALLVGEELHGVFEHDGPLAADADLTVMLGRHLPLHLIPARFHAMSELPRNTNGKVDLAAVRSWIEARNAAQTAGRERDSSAELNLPAVPDDA